jgi:alkylation response protein AidB-like acyl-CoA dehydrogenase
VKSRFRTSTDLGRLSRMHVARGAEGHAVAPRVLGSWTTQLYEGTNQVQRMVIARSLLR